MKSKFGTGRVKVKVLRSQDSPKYGVLEQGNTPEMDQSDAEVLQARGIVEITNPKPKESNGGK